MIWKIIGLSMIATLIFFGVWGVLLTIQNDADGVTRRDALPSMARAGEVSVNNTTLHLWAFDFEGKRCLWATSHYARGSVGGLTCWEETE